jgi:predicted DNA-binding transcriptional regulator AlpA
MPFVLWGKQEMPNRVLDAAQVGAEFGRSKRWIYDNYKRLVAEGRLPPPIMEEGHLIWQAAQVYAFLDRKLTPQIQALAAAFRAAVAAVPAAITGHVEDDRIVKDRNALRARRASKKAGGSQ